MSDWDSVASILAGEKTGKEVRLRGWVHRQRSGGKIAFVTLRDGSGVVQCTVKGGIVREPEGDEEAPLDQAKRAKLEATVEYLTGTVAADDRAPGGYEIKVTDFKLYEPNGPTGDFPLRGDQGTEFELDNRHLWLRSTELSAVLRIKSRLLLAVREFYAAEGFVEVDPSVITTNACEGGSTLFTFDYFGQTAYLSQSAQMYLEGCIFGTPKVYAITNSFRAEKSRTNKHLTEFHHLEAEYAWWDNDDNMAFQERMVEHLAHEVARDCEADLRLLGQDPARLLAIRAPFERVPYDDAVKRLQDLGFEFEHGDDFGAPHEHALTEGLQNPIFITDWPAAIKAFYMHQDPSDGSKVKCSDLLAPDGYGEIIGGSQRSEDIEWMKRRLLEQTCADIVEIVDYSGDYGGWNFDMTDPAWLLDATVLGRMAATDAPFAQQLVNIWTNTVIDSSRPPNYHPLRDIVTDSHGWFNDEGQPKPSGGWDQIHRELKEATLAPYEWYFDLRRYGSVPHSGFGLGIERLLRWFTGQEHIRDMLPYPRTPSRAYP